MYVQDNRIENTIANAKLFEKIVHMLFFKFKIKKATNVLSTRGEFFHKYCDFGEEQLLNCRALMIRIMALACHITLEEFEQYKIGANTTTLKWAHCLSSVCNNLDQDIVLTMYPNDIYLDHKQVANDIFLEDEMENFATSLFVHFKMYNCPEQVFLSTLFYVI